MDYESYFLMHAGFAWNGISSKVKITKMSSRSDDEDLGYQLRVYVSNLGKEGYWADALNFKKTWYGGYSSCWDCDYARSRIRINHDRFPNISSEFTKKKVATHEIGHSIGLRHPAKRHNGVEPTAIMNQGILTYNVPQSHDQVLIINKYGE